jgi:anti-sigma factor RsiW
MTCAHCLSMADAFLDDELPVDSAQDVIAHVEGCPSCRAELEARRALRAQLRLAFGRSVELAAAPSFARDMRASLRMREERAGSRGRGPRTWLGFAAAAAILALAVAIYTLRNPPADGVALDWARLAAHAAGDHRFCALEHALEEPPIPLEEAARRYDPAFGRLREVVEASTPVRRGDALVVAAHACVFERRRFGHVVIRRGAHLLSVLVTTGEGAAVGATPIVSCGRAGGFETACARAGRHVAFVVSDLDSAQNLALAAGLLAPLQNHLVGGESAAGRDRPARWPAVAMVWAAGTPVQAQDRRDDRPNQGAQDTRSDER